MMKLRYFYFAGRDWRQGDRLLLIEASRLPEGKPAIASPPQEQTGIQQLVVIITCESWDPYPGYGGKLTLG